jgi:hypothetical protein
MLEARERLGFVMDVAAATGNLKKRPHRQHMRDLRRVARGASRRPEAEPITRSDADSAPADISVAAADFGIEVVFVDEKPGPGWPAKVSDDG